MKAKFKNRTSAAYRLGGLVRHQALHKPLILSIPNGGVEVGCILSSRLKCEDNIILVRKIPSPLNPHYSIGAVSEFGDIHLNDDSYGWSRATQEFAQEKAQALINLLLQQRTSFSSYRFRPEIRGRDVMLVDDGVVTGETALEAIRFIRLHAPRRVLLVTPVVTKHALERMRMEQVDVVCLAVEKHLDVTAEAYEEFPEFTDADVIDCLKKSQSKDTPPRASPELFSLSA